VSPSLIRRPPPSAASKSLAEQFEPIVAIHETVRLRELSRIDVSVARERNRAGRPGFDAESV
jgi:hypothetical protein